MISKSRIYLTEDRKTAVPAGDPRARTLLVIQGGEISDAVLAKYEGAAELAGGKAVPTIEEVKAAGYSDEAAKKIVEREKDKHPEHKHGKH